MPSPTSASTNPASLCVFCGARFGVDPAARDTAVQLGALLAREGINGTVAGAPDNISALLEFLRADPRLHALEHKESWSDKPPFRRMRVRVKREIVTLGVPGINPFELKPGLTNSKLFARDRNICAYCGDDFHETELTREHIIPFGQHGLDTWMNVVTACRACNHRKANRTPEQARMPLLYTPYVPTLWEDFILRNRRILADQMEFLTAHLPRNSRLAA